MLFRNSDEYNKEIKKFLDVILMTAYSLNPPKDKDLNKILHNITYQNVSNSSKKEIHLIIHNHTLNKMIELIAQSDSKRLLISENKNNEFFYRNSIDYNAEKRITQIAFLNAKLVQLSKLDKINKYYYVTDFKETIFNDNMIPYSNTYKLQERSITNTASSVLSIYSSDAPKKLIDDNLDEFDSLPEHFDDLFDLLNSNKLNSHIDFLIKSCLKNITKLHNDSITTDNTKAKNSAQDEQSSINLTDR